MKRAKGFTLVELLVALAILAIAALLGMPALQNMLHQNAMQTTAREIGMLIQLCRQEAITRGVPCVVAIEPDDDRVFAFADVHGAAVDDSSDGLFNPIAGEVYKNTDYEVRRLTLRRRVAFQFDTATGLSSVDGFDNPDNEPAAPAAPYPDGQAMLEPDGSIMATGAFRLGDDHGNTLEVRVEPQGTARVTLRKHNTELNPNHDGSQWFALGEGATSWEWY